ncbi:dethiobiotin synthase [Fictibacillus sp. Mic-4]|uniref:dethiobiotin synthase n=1 Tax=Fictibacillus sp. Mic-4 TaxID=3132826 RepID=UPI003CEB979F
MTNALFITGVDTGVGKTVVTAYLTALIQKEGMKAVPFKPIQSGGIEHAGKLIAEDVQFYKQLAALPYSQEELCTYCLKDAVSPHLAANRSKIEIDRKRIIEQFHQLQKENDFVFVEGAGGLVVPLAEDRKGVYMTADLICDLRLPLLIVTHPELGTINHTLLTIAYAKSKGIPIVGLIFNQMPEEPGFMQEDNINMIQKLSGVPVIGCIPSIAAPLIPEMQKKLASKEPLINRDIFFKRLKQCQNEFMEVTN